MIGARFLTFLCWLGLPPRGRVIAPSPGLAAALTPTPSAVPADTDTCPQRFPVPEELATTDLAAVEYAAAGWEVGDDYEYDYEFVDAAGNGTGNGTGDDYEYEYNDRDTLFTNFNCASLLYGHDLVVADPVSEDQLASLRRQWALMRETYHELTANATNVTAPVATCAGKSAKGIRGLLKSFTGRRRNKADVERNKAGEVSAMLVPVRIGDAGPDKGRGVFATEPIAARTQVVDLDNGSTGFFKKRQAWRRLAEALPNETACNMLEWTFIQNLKPKDENDTDVRNGLTIFIAFDESNLMNNADWDGVTANIKCGSPPAKMGDVWGACRLAYYAVRDIAPGEELLISYNEFEQADQGDWWDIADK